MRRLLAILCLFVPPLLHAEDFQGATHTVPYDEETIFYSKAEPGGPVAELQGKLERGEVKLRFDEKHGYLPALLDFFKIPVSSQMLVFSKTSLQRSIISPARPRALYFNDDVYIGYIPNSPTLEVSAVDPKLGGMFYHLEQEQVRHPKFVRDTDCMRCHSSPRTMGVPGHLMRSVGTDMEGEPQAHAEVSSIDHCTPLADRWAGWFVTGTHGAQTHRGNLVGLKALERQESEPNWQGNLKDLSRFIDASPYPEPGSDIVALMVLEHQAHMHNYITRLNYETQIMTARYGHIRYLTSQENAFLRYLLFTEEAPLTGPVAGTSGYARDFEKMGPRDKQGRSLRDFDLQTRLFKYPCSFLIYSAAFDQLPEVMKTRLLQRLWDILNGRDTSPDFAQLSPERRHAILEILRDTKPNLPDYWRAPDEAGG